MDKSSERFGYIKDGKIEIRLLKGLNNHNWLVKKVGKAGVLKKKSKKGVPVAKSAPKARPSLRVSIPIQIYHAAMANQKKTEFKMPGLERIHTCRPPPPPNLTMRPPQPPPSQLTRPPSSFTPSSSLRLVRHPIPTGKTRTTMADKLEQIIRNPQPIYPNTTNKSNAYLSPLNFKLKSAPNKAFDKNNPEIIKTTINETATKPHNPCETATSEPFISIKHRLPLAMAPTKASNRGQLSNPVNIMENKLNNSQVTTTLQAATQTDKIFIVSEEEVKKLQMIKSRNITEDDFQILQLVKNSTATKEEIETQFDILKRQKENNMVIDLESDSAESSENSEVMKKCFKHSDENKCVLLAAMKLTKHLQSVGSRLPTSAPIPDEHFAATAERPPAPAMPAMNAPCSSSPASPFPKNKMNLDEMMKSLIILNRLKRFNFGLTSNNLEQTHTTNSNNQFTQTEDENTNKKRKTSVEAHPVQILVEQNRSPEAPLTTSQSQNLQYTVQIPQQTELVMFQQSQFQPQQLQLSQLQASQLQFLLTQQPQFHNPQLQVLQPQPTQMWTPPLQPSQSHVQGPQFQYPQIQTPQLQPPQMQTPQLQPPQMQISQFQSPQMQTPQLQSSQTQSLQFQSPQMQTPQLQSPQIQPPQFNPPRPQSSHFHTPQPQPSQLLQSQMQTPQQETTHLSSQQLQTTPRPQLQQAQIQPVNEEQLERPVQYFNTLRDKPMDRMTHKGTQFIATENQHYLPFDQNIPSTSTPHEPENSARASIQLIPNDRRRYLQTQRGVAGHMRPPHLARVLSTWEANRAMQESQAGWRQPETNRPYPRFCNRHGNNWPRGQY